MPIIGEVRNFHVKVIFLIHLILVCWSTLGGWSPTSYLLYNALFLFTLLWSIHSHDSSEAIQMAILINVVAIPLDIVVLAVCFPSSSAISEKFSAAIAIIHLIVRPFTSLFLVKIYGERNGSLEALGPVGNMFGASRNRSYEDMDKNVPPSQSQSHGSYDFSSAAQI